MCYNSKYKYIFKVHISGLIFGLRTTFSRLDHERL